MCPSDDKFLVFIPSNGCSMPAGILDFCSPMHAGGRIDAANQPYGSFSRAVFVFLPGLHIFTEFENENYKEKEGN